MRNKTFPPLTTDYAETMDKEQPWKVYPRPQLKRNSFFCLNGLWDFQITKTKDIPEQFNEKILVPFPPESQLSGIGRSIEKNDRLFYRKTFKLPRNFARHKVLLRFGAVDRFVRVYLNRESLGIHNCGYTPFFVDITDYLRSGENEIVLEVVDDLSPNYPYGKQKKKRGGMWYTPVSGIWQTVWIESVPENYIENIRIRPSLDSAEIEFFTKSKHKKVTLIESGEIFETDEDYVVVKPAKVINWTPENPYLYRMKIETETDSVESYFALRTITKERSGGIVRLCLNGKPYLFNGLLDQGYFPDGLFLPATPEGYENDIKLAKSLGFNTLRTHVKIEPAIFYHLCDKLGIAVFQDMVNNGKYSFIRDTVLPTIGLKKRNDRKMHTNPESRESFTECLIATANMLFNYPSVVYYTIFNEGWGQFDSDTLYERLKTIDETRIVDSTSGWFRQSRSDVSSHHVYFKAPNISHEKGKALVLSEFGGFSYRVEEHLFGPKNYGYSKHEAKEDFEKALFTLYERDVTPLVQIGVSALIYTQLSDVEDETNGLVTYDRRVVKIDAERMKKICDSLYKKLYEKEDPNEAFDMF